MKMVSNICVQASSSIAMVLSPICPPINRFQHPAPCLPMKPLRKPTLVKAKLTDDDQNLPTSSKGKNPLALVLEIPRTIWRQTLQPLSDFGFGQRSIWEGGVGLFIVSGVVLFALSMAWLRGFYLKSQFRKYQAVFEFSQACGLCIGTPVRIRGVTVGSVIHVDSSLKNIDAVVEVCKCSRGLKQCQKQNPYTTKEKYNVIICQNGFSSFPPPDEQAKVEDDKTVIPRNSLVEVNQSGLLMETLIDITPQDPIPTPSAGPLDPDCVKEGVIVCDRERIKGQEGVSLDALVGILTRLGQEMEEIGVKRSYKLAERVAAVVQEAQPLLAKMEAMAEACQPLLAEIRDSALLKEVESLTKSLAEATEDLRKVNSSILTPENTQLIRKSVSTLVITLRNIEGISSDISGFTGDEATRQNLKSLIKSLSRLL